MNLTFYLSLERIPLGIAVSLEFIGPLTLALLSSRQAFDFVWAALAALGIYFVMPHTETGQSLDLLGVVLALVAGGFWALYIFFGKRASGKLPGGVAASLGMVIAAIVGAPFGLLHDASRLFSMQVLPIAFAVAVLSSAIPYSLEMIAMKRLPEKTFSILMSIEPAFASLVGLLFLKEELLLTQWMAILFIIFASIGSSWGASRIEKLALKEIHP